MTASRSLFLDVSRFIAAFAVLLHHALGPAYLTPSFFIDGRKAVIVFFVISGFVIAYVTETSERTWRSYLAARASRIYSVVIPALLLTVLLDPIGMAVDPKWYVANDHHYEVIRLVVSVLFLNQSWNLTITPLSNGPYWSLPYEVWYYIIFGIIAFDTNPRRRLLLAVLSALIAGPRILLMSSVWIVGLGFYRLTKRVSTKGVWGFILLLAAVCNFFWILLWGNPLDPIAATFSDWWVNADGFALLLGFPIFIGGDRHILADLYLAISFGLVLLFVDSIAFVVERSAGVARLAKNIAAHTFSLYLYHAPLLVFFAAVTAHRPSSRVTLVLIILFTLVVVFGLSLVTEGKRPALRQWLGRRLGVRETRPPQ